MILPKKLLDFNHDLQSSFENITQNLHENIAQNLESITQNFEKPKNDFNDIIENKQYAMLDGNDCLPTPAKNDKKIKLSDIPFIKSSENMLQFNHRSSPNDSLMVLARRNCHDGKRRKGRRNSSTRPTCTRTKSESRSSLEDNRLRGSNTMKRSPITRHRSGDDDLMRLRKSHDTSLEDNRLRGSNTVKRSPITRHRSGDDDLVRLRKLHDTSLEDYRRRGSNTMKRSPITRHRSGDDDLVRLRKSHERSPITRHRSGDDDLMRLRKSHDRRGYRNSSDNGAWDRNKTAIPVFIAEKKDYEESFISTPNQKSFSKVTPSRTSGRSKLDTTRPNSYGNDKRGLKKRNEGKSSFDYKPSKLESPHRCDNNSNVEKRNSIIRHRSGDIDMIKMSTIRNIREKQNALEKTNNLKSSFSKKSVGTRRREQSIRTVRQRQLSNSV